MRQKYQGSTKVKRAQLQALRKEFESLAMGEGEKIDTFLGRTLSVVNKMKSNGEEMQQSNIVSKILRSLTPKFNYVVCSIEVSNDLSTLTIDELHGSLLVHEQRMQPSFPEEQALKTTLDERFVRGRGGRGVRGRGRGRGRPFDKSIIECYNCHKLGHFRYDCPDLEKRANYVETNEDEEFVLMSCVELDTDEDDNLLVEEALLMSQEELQQTKKEDVWFLDSGCSNHMTGNKEWFVELEEGYSRTVKLGNGTKMKVTGKGSVRMQVDGLTQVILDVYFVPDLRNNLLSVGQLQEKGLAVLFQYETCKIFHPTRGLIMHSSMSGNRMFYVLATMASKSPMCLQTDVVSEEEAHLWHCRFGHLNHRGLNTLSLRKMVIGLPSIKSSKHDICSSCLIGKQHREVIPPKSTWRAAKVLQLVHSDICGPIKPTSSSNKRYVLSFIDDFSRKTWVYLLHEKSEAFSKFKTFKVMVEKESGETIGCLRTDRGGEFTSNEFQQFCENHGIKRQLTTAFTPQQNGVAERKNRTIMNAVRTVLNERQVPKVFWPEAVKWCVHVQNRSPTTALENKTPEEEWSSMKPIVSYFRIFGCVAHAHVPDQKRSKLDDKSRRCVFLGVSDESKAYRLYDPETKKIIVSKDVIFEEEKGWEWDRNHEEPKDDVLAWEDENDSDVQQEVGENGTTHVDQNDSGSSSSGDIVAPTNEPNDVEEVLAEGRGARARRNPSWMADYVTSAGSLEEDGSNMMMLMIKGETDPYLFTEANKSREWREAMVAEIKSIEKNNTWELTELPKGVKPIGVKWVYKTKFDESGEVQKFKARLVAKGYAQRYGIDYTEVFAPVARLDTIRVILGLAAQCEWEVFQLDVKSAFLHGELKEEVFVEQPDGFVKKGEEDKVYKLKKALYGLKQAPRAWYTKIETYFAREGFQKCTSEHTLFTKLKGGNFLIVSLYVDDLIFTGNNRSMCDGFKKSMMAEFDMSDLGRMRYFLGLEVIQNANGIFICQRKYAREILARFGMENSNSVKNPIVPGTILSKDETGEDVDDTLFKQVVGSLMYLTHTRPDLMYSVSILSRYISRPKLSHWLAAKRILRYLKGTVEFGVLYKKCENSTGLVAYTDSNYAGDLDDGKSTSGFVFMMGSGAVSWSSKKQPVVSLSTTEAEYIGAVFCASQCIWLTRILEHMGVEEEDGTVIYCDNSSSIQLSRNPVFHGRTKHIAVRFHFLRELVSNRVVQLKFCSSENQVADIMTKPLKLEQFEKLRCMLGVTEATEIVITIAIALKFGVNGNPRELPMWYAFIVIAFICLYIMAYAWSWGPLGWLMPSEILPQRWREHDMNVRNCTNIPPDVMCFKVWIVYFLYDTGRCDDVVHSLFLAGD